MFYEGPCKKHNLCYSTFHKTATILGTRVFAAEKNHVTHRLMDDVQLFL